MCRNRCHEDISSALCVHGTKELTSELIAHADVELLTSILECQFGPILQAASVQFHLVFCRMGSRRSKGGMLVQRQVRTAKEQICPFSRTKHPRVHLRSFQNLCTNSQTVSLD